MSRKTHIAAYLGLCSLLAACDGPSPVDPTGLEAAPASAAAVNQWVQKRLLMPERTNMAAGAIDGVIYVVAGHHIVWETFESRLLSRVEAYSVATNAWSKVASIPGAREDVNGATAIGGKLYVTGGRSTALTPQGQYKPTKTLFVYDPATNRWTRKADMPQVGCGGVQGAIDGQLYVFMPSVRWCDPFGTGGTMTRFYRYDPAMDKWMSRAVPPNSTVPEASGAVVDGKFYLAGPNGHFYAYDPATNAWTARASMGEPRSLAKAGVVGGKLYFVGGSALFSEFPRPTLEVYDPKTNKWTTKASLPVGSVLGAAVGAGGKFYHITGWIQDGGSAQKSLLFAYTP
jgi:N-acetylneuraminic acid mutarotase